MPGEALAGNYAFQVSFVGSTRPSRRDLTSILWDKQMVCSASGLLRGRPGIAEQRCDAKIIAIAIDLRIGQLDEAGQAAEGRHCVGAHDLRRDEDMNAVDKADGEKSCVEARAGLSEEGQDAFFAQFVEHRS